MRNKSIIFTKHALERIKQRGLTKEWVLDIVHHHNEASPIDEDGTQELRKVRDGSYYYVVVGHKRSDMVIITAGECGKK